MKRNTFTIKAAQEKAAQYGLTECLCGPTVETRKVVLIQNWNARGYERFEARLAYGKWAGMKVATFYRPGQL